MAPITLATTETWIPPVVFILGLQIILMPAPAQLPGLSLTPLPFSRPPQPFRIPRRGLGDICLCSPAPDLWWHQILKVTWRWPPLLLEPSMGRHFPASLSSLQALLPLFRCPLSSPSCCYCCSAISSDRGCVLPRIGTKGSSPLPAAKMADGSPGL